MSPPTPKTKRAVHPAAKIYLLAYNALQFFGWSHVLRVTAQCLLYGTSGNELWEQVGPSLSIFQTGALLEIVHSLVGLVPSSVGVTFPQVFSRVFVLWPVLAAVAESRHPAGLPMLLTAWSVTEVLRYSYYALGLLNRIPSLLQWCRYSFFTVLYPLGITGELLCCYRALAHYDATQQYSVTLPNAANFTFSFYYFTAAFMVAYVPVFPMLYGHMLAQRRKVLNPRKQD